MINEQNNPIVNKHFELQIKTLQNAPRDEDRMEQQLLKVKQRQKEEARKGRGTRREQKAIYADCIPGNRAKNKEEQPYQAFLFAMNSPVTRERYSTRLRFYCKE